MDAADPNKDNKKQDKEENVDDEENKKIHEQGDEVIFIKNGRSLRLVFPAYNHFFNFWSLKFHPALVSGFSTFHRSSLVFMALICTFAVSQRDFDENEVDPYHGYQDKKLEPEAMDLPEDLNLDENEDTGKDREDEGDGETYC